VNSHRLQSTLRSRFDAVEGRLRAACERSGRRRADVTLVAVTKTVGVAVAQVLPALGVLDLGENRPQQLWRKAAALPATVSWHLIGHLQRNKVERTLPLVRCIHSVDSLRLLTALDAEAGKRQLAPEVLLEINASREANKHGFGPEEAPGLPPALAALRHLRVTGLMTMAAYAEAPRTMRRVASCRCVPSPARRKRRWSANTAALSRSR
jgi:pyridoxal phosphate enzyme (YggS family)